MIEHKRLSRGAMSTRLIDHCAPAGGGIAFDAPEYKSVQDDTNSAVFVTLLEIVGGGIVYNIFCKTDVSEGDIRLTIDGFTQTLINVDAGTVMMQYDMDLVNNNYIMKRVFASNVVFRSWFQDEFKFEYRITTANNIYAKINYGLL